MEPVPVAKNRALWRAGEDIGHVMMKQLCIFVGMVAEKELCVYGLGRFYVLQ